jgi:hypothetical protein
VKPTLLSENQNLSEGEFTRLDELRQRLRAPVDHRDAYIVLHDIDRDFALPAANWGPESQNDFQRAYEHVRDGGYEAINRLRFWVQVFTGYNLMHLRHARGLPSVAPIPADIDASITAAEPDVYVRSYPELAARLPPELLISYPRQMGEIGWEIGGRVVNFDVCSYQWRIVQLHEAGVLRWLGTLGRPPRILEIGGGYGALAFALFQILGEVRYTICDLPECLMFSGLYLSATTGHYPHLGDVRFGQASDPILWLLPNYMFLELAGPFDLVINTLSLAEMSSHQADTYAAGISRLIGASGAFFEQNTNNERLGFLDVKKLLPTHLRHRHSAAEYPLIGGHADLWANRPLP